MLKYPVGNYVCELTGSHWMEPLANSTEEDPRFKWVVTASPVARIADDGERKEIPFEQQRKVYFGIVVTRKSLEKWIPTACRILGIPYSQNFADEKLEAGRQIPAEVVERDGYLNWNLRAGAPKAGTKSMTDADKFLLKSMFNASAENVDHEEFKAV